MESLNCASVSVPHRESTEEMIVIGTFIGPRHYKG